MKSGITYVTLKLEKKVAALGDYCDYCTQKTKANY